MSEAVGKLWIELELQSGKFTANMDAVEKRFEKTKEAAERIGATMKDLGVGLAAFGAAVVGSMGVAVNSWAKAGDEVADLSRRTGIGVVALQELGYVARLSGTNMQELEVAVKKMQSAITDADNGAAAAKASFSALGLRIKDIKDLSPEQQFNKISEALAGIEDPTKRASLAVDLFGRSGTQLLPMLADGAAGLRKAREEAYTFSNVMSKDTVAAAEALNDDLDRLKMSGAALGGELAQALLPTVRALVDDAKGLVVELRSWINDNQELFASVSKVVLVVGGLSAGVGAALLGVAGLGAALLKMKDAADLLTPVVSVLWKLIAAHPFVAAAAAAGFVATALLDMAIKSQDAANANINMGATAKDLVKIHEDEKKAIEARIAVYEGTIKRMSEGSAAIIAIEQKVAEERKRLALIETAIKSEQIRAELQEEAEKNAALIAGDATTHAARLSLTEQWMANKTLFLKAATATEKLMNEEMYASLGSSFYLFTQSYVEQTTNWYKQLQTLASGFQGSLSAGFATTFKNIGEGWSALGKGMQAFGDTLINAIINQIADLAAAWVVKHTVMAAATALWGKKEIATNAAVAGSKAAAESSYLLWGAIAVGAAVMAGVLAFGDGFAQGGIVGGSSYTGDNVAARVNSGEMILNRSQQAALFDMANGGGGSRGEQTIIVNLDGREIARTTAEHFPAILRLYGASA